MVVAENLRGGFIDEANLVGGIDDQQAFAQMLHDVLRQLGEVGQIEVLLAHQVLAFAHAAGDEARGGRNGEQHDAQQAGGRIGHDVGVSAQLLPDRVGQHRDGGDRRQEQGAARRQQEREAAHGEQQQQSQAAGDAAAGVQDQQQQARCRPWPAGWSARTALARRRRTKMTLPSPKHR